jgi:hypothetical protein
VQSKSGTPRALGGHVQVRRRSFVVASACAAVALVIGWLGFADQLSLVPPVAAQVRFEVRLAEPEPAPGLQVARVADSGLLVYVHPETVVGNSDIAHTWVIDDGSPQFGVGVQLLPDGAQRMRQATAAHVGRPVVILLDGVVMTAPTLRSPIDDSAVITGQFTRDEAARIAEGIQRR